jgi:hypothetical protein
MWFANELSAQSNLDKSDRADVKLFTRTTGNEVNNPLLRPWPTQLRPDVGIE